MAIAMDFSRLFFDRIRSSLKDTTAQWSAPDECPIDLDTPLGEGHVSYKHLQEWRFATLNETDESKHFVWPKIRGKIFQHEHYSESRPPMPVVAPVIYYVVLVRPVVLVLILPTRLLHKFNTLI